MALTDIAESLGSAPIHLRRWHKDTPRLLKAGKRDCWSVGCALTVYDMLDAPPPHRGAPGGPTGRHTQYCAHDFSKYARTVLNPSKVLQAVQPECDDSSTSVLC